LATIAALSGDSVAAEAQYAEAARLARSVGCRVNAAISDVNRALRMFERGAFEGLRDLLDSAIRNLDLEGQPLADHARVVLCRVEYATGALTDALATATNAIERLERAGDLGALNDAHTSVAQLLTALGDTDGALEHARHATEYAERAGSANGVVYAGTAAVVALSVAGNPGMACKAAEPVLNRLPGVGRKASDETLCRFAEAALLGLPVTLLARVPRSTTAAAEELRTGILAWAAGGPPEAIELAADRLDANDVGERQAERRILGRWLRAEALRLRGDAGTAHTLLQDALARARALGHVPLTRKLEGALPR
jgi:tetratricopeptide (TPR) repeat protein